MNAKHLILSLAVSSLLAPAALSIARADDKTARDNTSGPLPRAVREATERFRDLNQATSAGYVQFQGCVSSADEGAMGVHYVNFSLFDDKIEIDRPEALVYEPRQGGLRLVAAEYITPAAAWEGSHSTANGDLPSLIGHLFHFAPGPNRYGPAAFYELHVWAWKNNPRGAFADWNPDVSCAGWPSTTHRHSGH